MDTTTKWIATNWRDPNADDLQLWFAMALARLINLPATLAEVQYPHSWNPKRFEKILKARAAAGLPVYSGAYMLTTHGKEIHKAEYTAHYVLTPLWKDRLLLNEAVKQQSLAMMHFALVQYEGIGSFLAGQIIADIKQVRAWREATDWWTFAASGPGSKRGLNRVYGRDEKATYREKDWHNDLLRLKLRMTHSDLFKSMPVMCAQDLQNCCCEFSKYERAREGFKGLTKYVSAR